ncbi:MAG: spermidine synthase [Bacteriovorax sp.]
MSSKHLIKFELLLITSVLAFCSIVYELLLSNTLAIVTGNYIWWQSLTVGVYIGGLGLGAYFSDRLKDAYKSLMIVELGLSFLGAICVVYVYLFHGSYKYLDNLFFFTGDFYSSFYLQNMFLLKIVFFLIIQSLTLSIGVLSGFEIPLMMKIADDRLGTSEEGEHQILGINYLGTLGGTICFAYFLLPKLDVIKTSVAVASLNLLVCAYCLLRYVNSKRSVYGGFIAALVLMIATINISEYSITQRYLKFFYYLPKILGQNNTDLEDLVRRVDSFRPIERSKSLYQYVDIFTYPTAEDSGFKDSTILTLDTNFQFNTTTEFFYHQAFAHASIAMNKIVPKKILLLGGGDGLLLRELLKYKEIESIEHIELDQKMIDLAKTRFAELNKHSLDDPRVHTQINDGFYYVRNTTDKYDAIFIDFPYPNSYDLARLYSLEFYTYVKKTLSPGGFVVLDAPFYNKEDYTKDKYQGRAVLTQVFNDRHVVSNSVIASTFYYAGFKSFFPYRVSDESFIFLKAEPGAIDYDFMDRADLSKLEPQTIREMKEIKNQQFPYNIALKYVNSIFKPTVVKKNEF